MDFNPRKLSFEDRIDNPTLTEHIKNIKSYKHPVAQSEAKSMGRNYIFYFHHAKMYRGKEVKYYNFAEVEWNESFYSKETINELDEFFRNENYEELCLS